MDGKKLYRDTDNKMIMGVCSGIAAYANMDVTLVRLITALAAVFTSGGVAVAYVIAGVVIPEKPKTPGKKTNE